MIFKLQSPLKPPIRPGSLQVKSEFYGKFPFDAFEFDQPSEENPIISIKSPWSFKVVSDIYTNSIKSIDGSPIVFDDQTYDDLGIIRWVGDNVGTALVLDQSSVVDNTWYTVTFSNVPDSTKGVIANVAITSATSNNKKIWIRRKGDTIAIGDYNCAANIADVTTLSLMLILPINDQKQCEIACLNADALKVSDAIFILR